MRLHVSKLQIIIVMSFGLLAISSSSVLTKLCTAPAFTIALYRVGIASLFYFGVARVTGGPLHQVFDRSRLRLAILSGMSLALHFATWISSLSYTSVASSVVLVVTSPVWVAIGSYIFLKEPPQKLMLLGIVITLTGTVIISGTDLSLSPERLLGNVLAIAGAIFAAVYFLIGRKLRADIDTFQYVTVVYASAALFTILIILFTNTPVWGFSNTTYIYLIAIAAFPQIVGHTSFNWALKYFSATSVAIVTLGEPIGASILAWIFLGERITMLQFIGGCVVLLGVTLALLVETRSTRRQHEELIASGIEI